jgi:signal transduction histidine kinase
LRSPLTNIIGFTQLISDVNVGPLNDRQREYLGYVMTSSRSLLTIINDILDLATIDAGIIELELGRVELARAVDAAIDGLRDRIREKDIAVERRISDDVGAIFADEKRLRQILYNLLSNAIGFSGQGGKVTVTARRDRGNILLVVDDEGVGIPDDFIGMVFDRFESRAAGAARGGVGLGLAIVKSFVELHGGTVSIKSRPNKGTTVRVTLPIEPQPIGIAAE